MFSTHKIIVFFKKTGKCEIATKTKKTATFSRLVGAEDRGRTGTILLSQDFKSCASACSATSAYMEAPPRFELGNEGFADLGLTTWLWCHCFSLNFILGGKFKYYSIATQ
jgi:hypothetical protein